MSEKQGVNWIDAEAFNLAVKSLGESLERMMVVRDAIPYEHHESEWIGEDGKWWHGGGA